jgi:hypothetical protein
MSALIGWMHGPIRSCGSNDWETQSFVCMQMGRADLNAGGPDAQHFAWRVRAG